MLESTRFRIAVHGTVAPPKAPSPPDGSGRGCTRPVRSFPGRSESHKSDPSPFPAHCGLPRAGMHEGRSSGRLKVSKGINISGWYCILSKRAPHRTPAIKREPSLRSSRAIPRHQSPGKVLLRRYGSGGNTISIHIVIFRFFFPALPETSISSGMVNHS